MEVLIARNDYDSPLPFVQVMRMREGRSQMMRRRREKGLPSTRRRGRRKTRERERGKGRTWMRRHLMSPTSCWMK